MHPALWISKTGLDAQQVGVGIISNNLANVNTVGFKRDRGVFTDLFYQKIHQPGGQSSQNTQLPTGLMLGTGVRNVATQKIFSDGNVIETSNNLDVAISGRGFFQVARADGSQAYTRDGQFSLDTSGQLVTATGLQLTPAITIPQGALSVTISQDGIVSVLNPGDSAPSQVGTIQISDFINPAGLQPVGDGLYVETAASGAPQTGEPGANGLGILNQGFVESSNVNVVEELVNLIETQRAYEMNAKAVQAIDDMLGFVSQSL